jgi:hypothetical protein
MAAVEEPAILKDHHTQVQMEQAAAVVLMAAQEVPELPGKETQED